MIYDPWTTQKTKMVLKTENMKTKAITVGLMALCACGCFCLWLAKYLPTSLVKFENTYYQRAWGYLFVVLHSVAVTYANKGFKKVSQYLVKLENHKWTNDHENSLVEKTYFLAFINCYIGLFAAALWDRSYSGLSFSVATILVFKQIIVNLIELIDPYCSKPKQFRA